MEGKMKAPFPWFGGKSRVAPIVWDRFGDVPNYVEPFFGSGAVLLGRPGEPGIETVNDLDGFVCNAWRSIQHNPAETAHWADWPANENDLHARHYWLMNRRDALASRLEGDPDYFDPKIAGWWLWGMACWIGGGFCAGTGPWSVVDGQLIRLGGAGRGVKRQLLHLGDAGQGVQRRRLHLGPGRGVDRKHVHLADWFAVLSARLQRVRVCCGDWKRICGRTPTYIQGLTGVFLDPPYSAEVDRDMGIYSEDSGDVAPAVREWAIEASQNPLMRIALCGYEGEHEMPSDWECVVWKAHGGYAHLGQSRGQGNRNRERIWFSPACLKGEQTKLL